MLDIRRHVIDGGRARYWVLLRWYPVDAPWLKGCTIALSRAAPASLSFVGFIVFAVENMTSL
jgi:hypothetical protein